MKKYFKTHKEALKAKAEHENTSWQYADLHIFRMPKGTRKAGWFVVCSEAEYLNTY